MAYRYLTGWCSERGRRPTNQDAATADSDLGFVVVADGMGGAAAGDRASRIAVETTAAQLAARLKTTAPGDLAGLLADLVAAANGAVHAAAEARPDLRGMGTTLVVAAFRGDRCGVAHVGDSRAYLVREGRLIRLSRDHSLVQARVDAGLISAEEARHQVDRNVITRAVGVEAEVTPDIVVEDVRPGDLLVLTTDGVHAFLSPEALLRAAVSDAPGKAAARLVEHALATGSNDNATAALVRVTGPNVDGERSGCPHLPAPPPTEAPGATHARWLWAVVLGLIAAGAVYLAPRLLNAFLGTP